ncbi:MAG: CGNR zinc finger domain-containing protein [Candidatus Dormibacteraeota bacterium]|nr:CGNR zinc finger domain-containing protein [Candidatus Dormibacteraeota bacterium]
MQVYDGADRSTFQALMTVASGTRRFDTPANATAFLSQTADWWRENSTDIDWHVPAGSIPGSTLVRLREIRDAVHALASGHRRHYQRLLRKLANRYSFALQVPDGGLRPTADGWEGFTGRLLLPLAELGDQADRLRECANDECHWMFLDFSRNGSRTWCHNDVCGNKIRVRRFREREKAAISRPAQGLAANRRMGPKSQANKAG